MGMTKRNLRQRRLNEVNDNGVIRMSRSKSSRPTRKCVLKKTNTSDRKSKKELAKNDVKKITKGKVLAVRVENLIESSIKSRSVGNDSNMKQMSLKESFDQAIAKRLRPRCNLKNYCEDSTKSTEQDVTVAKQLNIDNGIAVPIYKSLKNQDECTKEKSDIYDFKFDVNDSKERITKKKRRRAGRKIVTKKVKKQNIYVKSGKDAQCMVREANDIPTVKVTISEPAKIDEEKSLVSDRIDKVDVENVAKKIENSEDLLPEKVFPPKVYSKIKAKPVVVSIENIDGNKKADPCQKKNSNANSFRATNAFKKEFNIQHENMFDHSLFSKSLSPILKATENFDPGSPWRTPPLFAFSHVKNLFQSTPQDNRTNVTPSRKPRYFTDYTKNLPAVTKDLNSSENNNEHITIQTKTTKDYLACSRKFGTEITNIDHPIQPPSINVTNDEQYETSLMKNASNFTNVPTVNVSEHSSEFDVIENKENAAPNYQSPKKIKKQKSKTFSRLKQFHSQKENLVDREHIVLKEMHLPVDKENLEPQPGPSGMQKRKSCDKSKPLKQTNLNNFLNLPDMPQSIKISTAHGIFNDVHSSPTNANSIKTLPKEQHDIKNAFGLCDNESEPNSVIIETILPNNEVQEKVADSKVNTNAYKSKTESSKLPIRLPPMRIKETTLSVKTTNTKVQNEMEKLDKEENGYNEGVENEEKKHIVEAANFIDTFDILSESEQNKSDQPSVSLFVDLEPGHFTKPPKHSYKRKRDIRFNFTEDATDDIDEDIEKLNEKKKKYKKIDKKAEKRIKEWVKSINKTFSEIDHHTLLVE